MPNDVKIVGYDNNYFSKSTPTLTTIEQSASLWAKPHLTFKLMKNEEIENPHVIIDVKLIERESSK